jgi:hypothetical protein
MVLSMLATPFIIITAAHHRHEAGQQRMATTLQMTTIALQVHQHRQARHHLRLQRAVKPGADAGRETSASRWTWT